jgi:hypothetical protein
MPEATHAQLVAERISLSVNRYAIAFEYRNADRKGLSRIVDLKTRTRMYEYIARHASLAVKFEVTASHRAKLVAAIEALGFTAAWCGVPSEDVAFAVFSRS